MSNFPIGSQVKFVQDPFQFLMRTSDTQFNVRRICTQEEFRLPICFLKENPSPKVQRTLSLCDGTWLVLEHRISDNQVVFISKSPLAQGEWCLKKLLVPVDRETMVKKDEKTKQFQVGQLIQLKQEKFPIISWDKSACIIQIGQDIHWSIESKLIHKAFGYGQSASLTLSNATFEICCIDGNSALIKLQGYAETSYVHIDLIECVVQQAKEKDIPAPAQLGLDAIVKNAQGDFGTVESIRYYVKFDNGSYSYLESDQIFAATQKEKNEKNKREAHLKIIEEKKEQVIIAIKKLTYELDGLLKEKLAIVAGEENK